ncbi:hypothetical protein BJX96DRAFT_140543 [Aspergillus floccosus]
MLRSSSVHQTILLIRTGEGCGSLPHIVGLHIAPWQMTIGQLPRWYRTAFTHSLQPLCIAPFTRVQGWHVRSFSQL